VPKLAQPDQHCEHPFKLSIQVNLIPRRYFKAVGGIGDAERLVADGIAML
jgi:hypothetical protein